MSADAASLPCPICLHAGMFDSVQSLRDRLIHVSTHKLLCPVCQEEISGLDKLTIHLFSHVQIIPNSLSIKNDDIKLGEKSTPRLDSNTVLQQKKPRIVAKNKPPPSNTTTPMKYVKIYPRLPVISVNTVPILDISKKTDEQIKNETIYIKTEAANAPINTTCSICGLQFIDSNILKMHKCLIHNIDDSTKQSFTRYNCHICPKNFKMRGSLMVHLRVAHFGFSSNLNNTESGLHNNEEDGKKCVENQEKSLNSTDKNDNKQWQCDVCRKFFTTKYFLKKHKRLHTGETPYACSQCNKTFTFQQSYHKHLLYHNDEKPHTCSYCGRAFKELSTLHNHQRIHTGEKPFACETCGKCFRQRVSYLVHRRIHTGVMPYKCTACDKSFRYKVSQRTHKCLAQPPGTVVRQTGDLVEKLRRKNADFEPKLKPIGDDQKQSMHQSISYNDVSEASVELVRTGAQISLEDMESDSFRIISEYSMNNVLSFAENNANENELDIEIKKNDDTIFHANIEELINASHLDDSKSIPSPSDILKNLCLTKDEEINNKMDNTFC